MTVLILSTEEKKETIKGVSNRDLNLGSFGSIIMELFIYLFILNIYLLV